MPIIDSFPDAEELDQYFPPQYNSMYGQPSVPCTTSTWSTTNYQRINGNMSHSSYPAAPNTDISSPYDLSNHPSPANSSQNMHSPSYQSTTTDCKYQDEDRNATIKLEPARQRQNARQFDTYDVSPPPPRYPVEHTNYSSASPNSYPATTASGSPTYQYLGIARQMYNPAIPVAVPAEQQWNRSYTWTIKTFTFLFDIHCYKYLFFKCKTIHCTIKKYDWLIMLHMMREWLCSICVLKCGSLYKVVASIFIFYNQNYLVLWGILSVFIQFLWFVNPLKCKQVFGAIHTEGAVCTSNEHLTCFALLLNARSVFETP